MVTATRLAQPGFALPAAIDAIAADVIREDNPQVNLSETLNRVPGIVVQNRQNYAQDLQVSSRGFGGRATFGVRGVRLIADGIPATMPDGQGQAATFDLATAERIEVLRGPFASLYGNASGGVVQVFTADGPPRPTLEATLSGGSFGQRRANLRFGGEEGSFNYLAGLTRFESDGYREHSAVVREQLNAKARVALGRGTLTALASGMDQPDTQDPLGLTRAQFEADPRQVDASAILFDTRKSIRQGQGGLVYESGTGRNASVQARLYGGTRTVVQFLGQTGDTPLGSGGVVDLDRSYAGVGVRGTLRFEAAGGPMTLSIGADRDRMDERRRGYVNNFGTPGALRRDEDDRVSNSDVYLQGEWLPGQRWVVNAGLRRSQVSFRSEDHYVVGLNPDDSGSVTHARTTPAAGVLYKASPGMHLYANAGEGFETPTFAELAYRPGGATGLNLALQPAKSRHFEVGFKARESWWRAEGAVFRINSRDEIVTNSSAGGRTDFRNASRTRRDGVELSFHATLPASLTAMVALTALRATFEEGYTSGTTVVAAGRRLPGVPDRVAQAELAWRPVGGFHAAVEVRRSGAVHVNEANTDAAAGYTVANVRVGLEQRWSGWRLREYLRVDNITDRRYAGSVIVAEARERYFEPAPGRNWYAGVEFTRAF